MSTLRLIVLGLVLLIGLLPAGGEVASSYGLAVRLTGDSLVQVTPSVTQPGQVDEGRAFVYYGSGPPAQPIPGLTRWGLIAMAGALVALVLWRLRRKPAIRRVLV